MLPLTESTPMPTVEKRTISLSPAQASYIDALVETGTYASASEVMRAGLRALQERDAAVERWLRDHHADRLKKASRDA